MSPRRYVRAFLTLLEEAKTSLPPLLAVCLISFASACSSPDQGGDCAASFKRWPRGPEGAAALGSCPVADAAPPPSPYDEAVFAPWPVGASPPADLPETADAGVDVTCAAPHPFPVLPGDVGADAGVVLIVDGDSISFGYGVPSGKSFAELSATLLGTGVELVVLAYPGAGITGDSGEDVTFDQRVRPVIEAHPGALIIVTQNAGINDSVPDADTVWDHEAHYCEQVRAAGARCVLVGLLPRVGNSYGHYERLRSLQTAHWPEVAEGYLPPLADPRLLDAGDRRWFQDGLHPTANGHVALALELLPILEAILADAGVLR